MSCHNQYQSPNNKRIRLASAHIITRKENAPGTKHWENDIISLLEFQIQLQRLRIHRIQSAKKNRTLFSYIALKYTSYFGSTKPQCCLSKTEINIIIHHNSQNPVQKTSKSLQYTHSTEDLNQTHPIPILQIEMNKICKTQFK